MPRSTTPSASKRELISSRLQEVLAGCLVGLQRVGIDFDNFSCSCWRFIRLWLLFFRCNLTENVLRSGAGCTIASLPPSRLSWERRVLDLRSIVWCRLSIEDALVAA